MNEMTNRETRHYFEAEPWEMLKSMDLGDIDTLATYLEDMLDAVKRNAIHKHTAQKRLDEISAHAQVKHGVRTANLLQGIQELLNGIKID